MKAADILSHLPKKKDKGGHGDNLGAKDGSDNKGEDKEHCGSGVGGGGGGGSGDAVVITDPCTFMHKPQGLKSLAVQMRVDWMVDPMIFNAVPSQPLTNASSYMLQECLVHS